MPVSLPEGQSYVQEIGHPNICPVVNRVHDYNITMWAAFEGSLAAG